MRVGIHPAAGGRIVFYAPVGEENYLYSDPATWAQAPNTREFVAFNGHILWLAPQSHWGKRVGASEPEVPASWPPDLELTASQYEVVEKSATLATLRSPVSARSGLRLTKTVSISDNGDVDQEITLENASSEAVQWGLWSNTRVTPQTEVFVAIYPADGFTLGELPVEREATPAFAHVNGCLTWLDQSPLREGLDRVVGKLFIHKAVSGAVAILVPERKKVWVKTHALFTTEEVAPGHAPIELYLSQLADGSGLQEVEAHGAYVTLAPGARTTWEETWVLHERPQANSLQERAGKMNALLVPAAAR